MFLFNPPQTSRHQLRLSRGFPPSPLTPPLSSSHSSPFLPPTQHKRVFFGIQKTIFFELALQSKKNLVLKGQFWRLLGPIYTKSMGYCPQFVFFFITLLFIQEVSIDISLFFLIYFYSFLFIFNLLPNHTPQPPPLPSLPPSLL